LLRALQSRTEAVRVWGTEELGNQKDREATAGLVAALARDTAPRVRTAAATALRYVRPPEVAPLVRAFADPENAVRREAAHSLRELGDRSKVAPEVVRQVVEGSAPALANRVADDLWDSDDSHNATYSGKQAALEALRALAPQQAGDALLRATRSKSPNVKVWATEELARQKK
jgi:HEAT repeat protein